MTLPDAPRDVPVVTVITPTYNHEKFIGACLTSVINQTFTDWEVIVIDDGSTDGTEQIVRGMADEDQRIRYLRQDNLGPWRLADAYNRALRLARGQFVAVLEGDDAWPKYKLSYQVEKMRGSDAVMDYGIAGLIDTNGVPFRLYVRPSIDDPNHVTTDDLLLNKAAIQPTTVLVRREVLEQIGGFHGHDKFPAVDLPTWLAVSQAGRISFSEVILGFWRQHRTQITANLPIVSGAHQVALDFVDNALGKDSQGISVNRERVAQVRRSALSDQAWNRCLAASRAHDWHMMNKFATQTRSKGRGFRVLGAISAQACSVIRIDLSVIMAATSAISCQIWLPKRHERSATIQRLARAMEASEPDGIVRVLKKPLYSRRPLTMERSDSRR